jgi:hypothetical protein
MDCHVGSHYELVMHGTWFKTMQLQVTSLGRDQNTEVLFLGLAHPDKGQADVRKVSTWFRESVYGADACLWGRLAASRCGFQSSYS